MIDTIQMMEVLSLHERSFMLLRWIGSRIQSGTIDLSTVHSNMTAAEAAEEWLRRNRLCLPTEIRPTENQLTAFANLFASYLQTSFEVGRTGRRVSSCGCYCCFCSYFRSAPSLKIRSVSKKAKNDAVALKRLCLQGLARDIGVTLSQAAIDGLISEKMPLAREVAMVTYAHELIRRTQYRTQGEGVYALWRQFAWTNGHADRRFKLTLAAVQRAQESVLAEIRKQLA